MFYPTKFVNVNVPFAHAHAACGGCHDTRGSGTEIVLSINETPLYWITKRHRWVRLCSGEEKYIVLSICAKHASWSGKSLCEILEDVLK